MVRVDRFVMLMLVSLLAAPGIAFAQAAVTGLARDASGAVLPGVTVEAASPALIEKVRSAVTDGTGRYRIEELRPGTYTLTFTLPGFATVLREGIELTGTQVMTVNGDLRVGGVEETVTVTGASPVVDVQSTVTQRVLSNEMINTLPTGKVPGRMAALIPGVSTVQQDVGGLKGDGPARGDTLVHGVGDARALMNGMSTHTVSGSTGASGAMNMAAFTEVTVDTSGIGAEQKEGGLRINLIPKDGGNTFRGSFFYAFANGSMQGDNFTQELQSQGLPAGETLKLFVDVNPAFGGPIVRDKLWFHATWRYNHVENRVPVLFNKNAGDANAWTYEPDTAREPAGNDASIKNFNTRITWQARPKLRVGFTADLLANCDCPRGLAGGDVPEANANSFVTIRPKNQITGDFSAPLTSTYLLEGGVLQHHSFTGRPRQNPYFATTSPKLIQVMEQASGLTYRGTARSSENANDTLFGRVVLSHVTGAQALKVGFQYASGRQDQFLFSPDSPLAYRFNNGVPNRVTLNAFDAHSIFNMDAEHALFVQDRWTVDRFTITGGLRYDYFHVSFPETQIGPTQYAPTRNITFPATEGVKWHDLSPRLGMAVDLFGNGKTALKASFGKYLGGQLANSATLTGGGTFTVGATPASLLVTSATKSWTDSNRNFVVDCDLLNPAAQNLSATGGDICGAISDPNFGSARAGTSYDPDIMKGWGKSQYNWQLSAGLQHELGPQLSIDGGFFRSTFGNQLALDDRALSASDFDRFTITAPVDPRLPGGGGNVIGPLFNLKPAAFGRPADNVVALAKKYGKQEESWTGFDFNLTARPRPSILLRGGTSTGRRSSDNCDILAALPEMDPTGMPYCHKQEDFRTQVKMLGSYTLPKIDVLVSGTLQSVRGPIADAGLTVGGIAANYTATNADVAPSLGRPLSGGASNITVNLVQPGTLFGDRMTELDVRIGKIVRLGPARATIGLDIYNVLNSNPVLALQNAYASWLRPTSILSARFAKFNVQLDF